MCHQLEIGAGWARFCLSRSLPLASKIWHKKKRNQFRLESEVKTGEGFSADIYPWRIEIYVRTMSTQHLTRDICLARDICLFQGGHTHMQSELLRETGAKKDCGRRGVAGRGNPKVMPIWLSPAIAWLHYLTSNSDCMCVCAHLEKDIYILRKMLCGHSADIYLSLQEYKSTLAVAGTKLRSASKTIISELALCISSDGITVWWGTLQWMS